MRSSETCPNMRHRLIPVCYCAHRQALGLSRPAVVDVSIGECGAGGLIKDALKIREFISAAKAT